MTNDRHESRPRLFSWDALFVQPSPELVRLLEAAADEGGLASVDFLTLRDWLDLSRLQGQEPLIVLLLAGLLAHHEGSLCLEISQDNLTRRLADLIGAEEAAQWAQRIRAALAESSWSALIGQSLEDQRPAIIHTQAGRSHLYFHKFLAHETSFVDIFRARLERQTWPSSARLKAMGAALKEVLQTRPLLSAGRPLLLDADQRLALTLALVRDLAVISGGPGTGKTSIVLTLLRCLVRLGHRAERIVLAAPTGRAAQRLGDSIRAGLAGCTSADDPDQVLRQLQTNTLHQVLGYHPAAGTFRRHVENPVPADIVVVDEVSMVGLEMMAKLFAALAPGTKVILLGDKDQLPPVDVGAVLPHLVPGDATSGVSAALGKQARSWFPDLDPPVSTTPDLVALLRINHRSQRQVQEVAQAVNNRQADILERLARVSLKDPAALMGQVNQGGCFLLEEELTSPGQVRRLLETWADDVYLQGAGDTPSFSQLLGKTIWPGDGDELPPHLPQLFRGLEQGRLLTLVREGPWGSVGVNRYLEQYLRPRLDPRGRGSLFAGAPILVTHTDHARKLFNGDVGLALAAAHGGLRVAFPRHDGYLSFAAESLPAFELGFALTVHKSQGSEYDVVWLIFPPEGARGLLTKELTYTAITRARRAVVLCGKAEVIRQAITRQIHREAGLLETLRIGMSE